MYKVQVPVLLIAFNRPEIVKQNIENLRKNQIQNLYITIDGPRNGNNEDKKNVDAVRTLVKGIDFCSNIKVQIHEENVGAEVNVSDGIAWVLQQEEYVIVIEDDVMAHESFFRFMEEMLIRYRNDERIAMVSGCNYTPMPFPNNEDYCFCQSGHTWGWATWRRVWKSFNLYEVVDSKYLDDSFLNSVSVNKNVAKRRKRLFKKILRRGAGNTTWDYMFSYFRITRNLLSIVPRSHLTSNVGLYGLHYNGMDTCLMMKIDEEFRVRNHPQNVCWNREYDMYHYNHYLRENVFHKILRHLKKRFNTHKSKN